MSAAPVAAPRARTEAGQTLLEPRVARIVAFVALASFGAVGWGNLVVPSAAGRMLLCVVAAALGGLLLWRVGERDARTRGLVTGGVGLALAAVALVAAEVPVRMLFPDEWGTLAAGIGQGISSLPGVSVPYRGVDEWVRTTLLLGGGLLIGLAALLAFRPGPEPRGAGGAAVALGVLYAVPVVEHNPGQPFLSGALFAVLLCGFMWLERLERRFAGPALTAVVAAALAGVVVAPALDSSRPWLDYEQLAQDIAQRDATRFDWNHSYGELDWPRDGRELLRIRARSASYWKVTNLEQFDGVRWRRETVSQPLVRDTEFSPRHPEWFQSLRIVVRNLSTRDFIGAGTIEEISRSPRRPVRSAAGLFASANRPLRRGNAYAARVYVPKPSEEELRGAGSRYPGYVLDDLSMLLPGRVGGRSAAGAGSQIVFAPWGAGSEAIALDASGAPGITGTELVLRSRYARMMRLAQRLRASSATPYEFVRRVQRRVRAGATYNESPPPAAVPLDDFLFRTRIGYCQQFSGAMALLLRMGGVPARVAAGFSPGALDRRRGEYVVRDIDAHSWVEAYFPGFGWVTFDPTPSVAPPRDQAAEPSADAAADRSTDPAARGDVSAQASGPGAGDGGQGGGRLQPWMAVVAAVLVLAGALALRRIRRAGAPASLADDPVLRELQVALHRTGRTPPGGTTLARLETILGGSPGVRAYLRALRDRRYAATAGAGPLPTLQERRALRVELGQGLGVRGRIRAWWALPPRLRHRERAYNQL